MDNKIPPTASFICKFKIKAMLFLGLLLTNLIVQAQCPCTTTGCTTTISTSVTGNYNVGVGQTLCILSGGNITGSITLQGGTVNNSSSITPSGISFGFNGGTFNNCGTIKGSFSIYMDSNDQFIYNCASGTIGLTGTGEITFNGGGYFRNDGIVTLVNGDILDQGGDMFINNGTITITGTGNFTLNGQDNGFCNNGTINLTTVGSRFLANGNGMSNHGIINTYDFDLNGNNFYNACTVTITHDFSANGGSMTGPTAAGQYGRYNIAGFSGYNATNIGTGGSHLDICDAGHPSGGWDSKNGGSIGVNVTYCVNTASCKGKGTCTIPCTLPTPLITGITSVCPGTSTTLTAGGNGYYSWSTGETTSAISVTPNSTTTYTLTVINSCGSPTKSQVVTVYNPPTPNITGVTAICKGASTTLTATGGGTYSWNTGATSTSITVSPINTTTYTVTATNGFGCSAIKVQPVTVNANPTAGITGTTTICNGSSTTLTGTGGGTYSWNTGATSTSITVSPISTTTYTVTATNGFGCSVTTAQAVTVNANPIAGITGTTTICKGLSTTLTGTGGGTYVWSTTDVTTSIIVSPIVNTTYTVTVTNGFGCTSTIVKTVTVNALPTVSMAATPATCGGSNGTATVTATGKATLTYSWSPSAQITPTAVGLTSGSYTVKVTDGNGCTQNGFVSVNNATGPTASLLGQNNVLCTGSATGSATVTGTGGTGTLTYLWSPGSQTTPSISGLTAGTYICTVRDTNGCAQGQSVIISQPVSSIISGISSQINVGCTGSASGIASITATGGTGAFTYNWLPSGGTDSIASGLTVGNYNVTITDANGCTKQQTIGITQPSSSLGSSIVGSLGNVGCTGSSTGSATITGTGGTPTYFYSWSTGEVTPSISNLAAGTYSVTVTDKNGCTSTQDVVITEPTSIITATTSSMNAACGSSNGTASVTGLGGTPGYTYVWLNGGKTTPMVGGLTAGTYTVIVSDTKNCTYAVTAVVNGSPGPKLTVSSKSNITCNGLINGTATLTVSSGTAPYSYTWTPNAGNTSTLTGLSANTYTVVVSDSASCKDTTVITITEPVPITFALTTGGASLCTGESLTLLTSNITGGTLPYTFNWLPNGPVVSPLVATTYSLTVIDGSGCVSRMDSIRIVPLISPIAGFDTLSSGMFHQKYNFIDQSSNSNNWYWIFGDGTTSTLQNPNHTYAGAGIYTVTQIVTNISGCSDTLTKIIVVLPNILIPNVFTPNHDGINDDFWISSSGFESFELTIYDRWGLKLFATDSDEIRWDGLTNMGKEAPDGTYYFILNAILKTETIGKKYAVNGFINLHR